MFWLTTSIVLVALSSFQSIPVVKQNTQCSNRCPPHATHDRGCKCPCDQGYILIDGECYENHCISSPCVRGTCRQSHDAVGYTCKCSPGFTGATCDKNENPCRPSPCVRGTCQPSATAAGYSCKCPTGFTGDRCDHECSNRCPPHATYDRDCKCQCAKGLTMRNGKCECSNRCPPHATHERDCKCQCAKGLTMRNGKCECSNRCPPHATHDRDCKCQCAKGLTMRNGKCDKNPCNSSPCVRGTCRQSHDAVGYTCKCPPGFTGATCDKDKNPCKPSPCVRGTCQPSAAAAGFSCKCPTGFAGDRCDHECKSKTLDISFIVDASWSVLKGNFTIGLQFIQDFLNPFDIGFDKVRVSMVTFGEIVEERDVIGFLYYTDKELLKTAISKIPYRGGCTTETGAAIKWFLENQQPHVRKYAKSMIFLLTDGKSQRGNVTKAEAAKAKEKGLDIFAIGVGKNVSQEELHNIASDSEHVFLANDYRALEDIRNRLDNMVCGAKPGYENQCKPSPCVRGTCQPSSTAATGYICKCPTGFTGDRCDHECERKPLDITFFMSNNRYINRGDFTIGLQFIRDFLNPFDISPNKVRVSIFTFGFFVQDYDNWGFGFKNYTDKESLQTAISKIPYRADWTSDNVMAIKYFLKEQQPHVRKNVKSMIFLLATRKSSEYKGEAEKAKEKGLEIFAIGVGKNVSQEQLRNIASDSEHVFLLNDFRALEDIRNELDNMVCGVSVCTKKCPQHAPLNVKDCKCQSQCKQGHNDSVAFPFSIITVEKSCEEFWYYIPELKLTYAKARDYCLSHDGYLLHFDSLEEYDAVWPYFRKRNMTFMDENVWVGANDIKKEGAWVSEKDGKPLIAKWGKEPNCFQHGDCGALFSHELLVDRPCNQSLYFLCERTPL